MDSSTEPVCDTSVAGGNCQSSSDVDIGSSAVSATTTSSRLNMMSDEQREIKRRFEEKQREEARRSALAERIAKRKAISFHFLLNC